ncbi:MAG: alpha/beta hydrolase [Myxococcales bacterium]|nr:alpha/beta hydrolase [Myxococcales bacterium]
MNAERFQHSLDDGVSLAVCSWQPEQAGVRAVVQIAHGMAEHIERYAELAERLVAAGYAVYGADHRGHGRTAGSEGELGYFADSDGFGRVVEDLYSLNRRIAERHAGLPIVMLGHSMGAFLTQTYLFEHGESIEAAVISSTGGAPALLAKIAGIIARVERLRVGPRKPSGLLQALSFGGYNRAFQPARTDFDWLSRDAQEVDRYAADPLCGFAMTTQGWIDVLGGIVALNDPANIARVPRGLPLYFLCGLEDPMGEGGKAVRRIIAAHRAAGLGPITERFYPGGRHEMFHEVNRAEVFDDLIAWLDATVGRGGAGGS